METQYITKVASQITGVKMDFLISGAQITGRQLKIKLDPYLIPYIRVNSNWIRSLNIKGKTYKYQQKPGKFIFRLGVEKGYVTMAHKLEAKNDLIKFFKFLHDQENTINKVKRQLTNWEKIFASYTTKSGANIPTM